MQAIMGASTTNIYPTNKEVMELCKPCQGADTCIWLMMGADGWFCGYHNRTGVNLLGESLEERWKKGLTVAKRDGCDKVKNIPWDKFDSRGEITF